MNLEKLEISSSMITVNRRRYKFGEIHEIEKVNKLELSKMTEKEESMYSRNITGGLEWSSLKSDTMEPGDVMLLPHYSNVLEQQRQEKFTEVRQFFMEFLEKYLMLEQPVDPMEFFDEDAGSGDARLKLERLFERNNGPTDAVRILSEHPLVDYEKAVKRDEIAKRFPRAYERMTNTIEKMMTTDDRRLSTLQRLAYAPVIIPHFNAFSVLRPSNFPTYSNRLPDGLSIRQAFKQFSSSMFAGRVNIRAREFSLYGYGIIPLPVGFKIDCGILACDVSVSRELSRIACDSVVRRVDYVTLAARKEKELQIPMIKSCRNLEVLWLGELSERAGLSNLFNEILCLGTHPDHFFDFLEDWSKNKNRKIGSKCFINFSKTTADDRIDSLLEEKQKFLELGFQRDEENHSYRLVQDGNKYVEVGVVADGYQFSFSFSEYCRVDKYFCIEVISAH